MVNKNGAKPMVEMERNRPAQSSKQLMVVSFFLDTPIHSAVVIMMRF